MRVFLFLVAVLLSPLAAAELKVGVVDMERALFLSEEAKSGAQKFEKDNGAAISKVREIEKAMMTLKDKRETDGAIMSQDELAKLVGEYEEKGKERQFYLEKLQQQDQKWRQSFFRSKLPELEELLKALIEEGKYDLVLQAGAVVYSAPAIDLTKPLLERLNGK
ncbi:OmpH family outer membrane protein [Candidatus Thalassolituus haligoni]|uniref:OmpH family outer membrane protein n=1 Tax=Candidatus Thalassolituus haligoni TaxID=3100113 RepID=UPI003511C762|tara:strand:- start:2847 stop:3338 length:492 start_codon:yes stop_codon:yes gene_type:complete